jgi:hypothetical protein
MHPMNFKRPSILLTFAFAVGVTLWIGGFNLSYSGGQEQQRKIDQFETCYSDFRIAKDVNDKPILLNTEEATQRAIHCERPLMPDARLQSSVVVQIAVDPDGKVRCLKLLSGHPLCSPSAFEAAKSWTFHPMKDGNSSVGFLAQLVFQFSTGDMSTLSGSDCTKARWK